jgi:dephospho-CoA kinase
MSGKPKTGDDAQAIIKQWCIALTGAVATGKSTVGTILKSMGMTVIDADQLARDIVQPGQPTLEKIREAFGAGVISKEGILDRDKLRDIVMTDPSTREKLEAIMHPAIQARFETCVTTNKLGRGQIFFYEAALIFELGREHLFRETWATTCDEPCQLERLQERSKLPRDKCLDIIRAQWSAERKAKLANRSIDTQCSPDDLTKKIKELVKATNA